MLITDPAGLSNGAVGVDYTFTLTASNLPVGLTTVRFLWNFGDASTTATGNATAPVSSTQATTKITHTYAANGAFSLLSSVADTAGKTLAQDSEVVTIGSSTPNNVINSTLSACGIWQVATSGGVGATVINWDISTIPIGAKFDIKYNTFSIPDKIVVAYQGVNVWDSGWRGDPAYEGMPLYPGGIAGTGAGEKDNLFAKVSTNAFKVTVYGADPNTGWEYNVRCTT